MPLHSSTNITIAAAHDLTQALLHPSSAAPLLPLPDSQQRHIRQLAQIFQQHNGCPDTIPTIDPTNTPSPTMPTHTPPTALPRAPTPLPRMQPSHTPTLPPPVIPAPILRFASLHPPKKTARAPLPTAKPYAAPVPAVPLTVTPLSTPPPKRLTWATTVTGGIVPITTYISTTKNPGQNRRRATKAQNNAADRAAFLRASITIHPGLASTT
jgi:hypothetical protein